MKSERELLSSLINNKLGEGIARFVERVGRKFIDLVFEKKDEIWLIEAKRKLNYEAFGQIRTYKHLFVDKYKSISSIKLGIKKLKLGIFKKEVTMATCKTCNGTGSVKCPTCKGEGRIVPFLGSAYTCKNCEGSGVVKCGVCKGRGYI